MPGKRVFTVESDGQWASDLRTFLDGHDARQSDVTLLHVDIGPTKEWGRPATDRRWRNYWRYPVAVYSEEGFQQPDLILVDGVFRPACVVTAMMMLEQPARLLFDDYLNPRTNWTTTRPKFQSLEDIIKPDRFVGRMAVFDIEPRQIDAKMVAAALPMYFRYF